jgi:hypothetical protein
MSNEPVNKNLSLGSLYPAKRTKDRSPHCVGKIGIKRDLLFKLVKQLGDQEEVTANLAGWKRTGPYGPSMTIQISMRYEPSTGSDPFADLI